MNESGDGTAPVGPDVLDELTDLLRPLTSVDPGETGTDLAPIGDVAADVDVFGMGEGSHGTREFFRAKHRLFRFLVEEHGFRLLGIEANVAAGTAINDYVLRGEGSAEAALSQGSLHAVYRTESVLELVEWIREFNEGRPEADRVRVHGFDVQDSVAPVTGLKRYFEGVDPEPLRDLTTEIEQLTGTHTANVLDDEAELRSRLEARSAVVTRLGDALEANEREYCERTSRREYERARRLVWVIERGRKQYQATLDEAGGVESMRIRDEAMAEQVRWLLDHESAERIAIWAHNAHLGRTGVVHPKISPATRAQVPSLGAHLAESDELDYATLQLSLGGGTVRSAYVPEREFRAYEIDDPPSGSLPAVFGEVGEPLSFLDTSEVPSESALGAWFDSDPTDYVITGKYEETPVKHVSVDPKAEFDGILFVSETTAAESFTADDR